MFCFVSNIQAQQTDLTTIREISTCESFLLENKIEKCIACYEALKLKKPNVAKSYVRLAELYYQQKELDKVASNAFMAIDEDVQASYASIKFLSNQLITNNDIELASKILNKLASALSNDSIQRVDVSKKINTSKQITNSKFYFEVNNTFKNLGEHINTKENEFLPTMSMDGNTLVFTRNVGGNEDFFIAQKDSLGQWLPSTNMGYPPNTGLPDGGAKLSADGNYLFFTRCDMRSPNGYEGGGCDIAFCYKEKGGWSSPQYFGYTINTTAYEGQPCLSSDNKDLYFVSNRPGGYGGMDIWVTHFINNMWTQPENLGPKINTEKDEIAPFIHPDNESLYFASNGHPGLGNMDLFLSRKNYKSLWSKPINLDAPINTKEFDGSIIVNAKGDIGISASDRQGTLGGLDLYQFSLHDAIKPIQTICLKGFVKDKYYKNNLSDRLIEIRKSLKDTQSIRIESNAGDGSFACALHAGYSYYITILEPGYRPFYKWISLQDSRLPENYLVDFKLKQPGYRDTLFHEVLQFDTVHSNLESESDFLLEEVIKKWKSWNEDSAIVKIFLNTNYYYGDTLGDSTYFPYLQIAQEHMDYIIKKLERNHIPCENIMPQYDMLIYNDENSYFNEVKVTVLENY
ncbi:MAG: hypothetical protein R2831_08590 [Chitinophagaceae bacterium]